MTQVHTAALESAQRIEDYQRADIEAILSARVREFLDDFDTVKAYSLNKAIPTEWDISGAVLKEGIDELLESFGGLGHYAGAIRSGAAHSWQ